MGVFACRSTRRQTASVKQVGCKALQLVEYPLLLPPYAGAISLGREFLVYPIQGPLGVWY